MISPPVQASAGVKRRIFVVDDHPMVRAGLTQLINHEPDLLVVGQADATDESLRALPDARADIVLIDLSLKDGDGIDLVKALKSRSPGLPTLVISMHDETLYAERALRAGACGYVMKQEEPQTLLAAIRAVLAGQVYVSPQMGETLIRRLVSGAPSAGLPMDRLSNREAEIFRMIGFGSTVKEIAAKLNLSSKTIEAHRDHIKQKLNFKSSAELLRFAIRNSPDPG